MSVRHGSGQLLNSEGRVNEKGTWGRQAAWCAGFGAVGDAWVGMMVTADPANFRPSWFHPRDYGLIVANPFGKKAMTAPRDKSVAPDTASVKSGDTFKLGFGVYVFCLPDTKAPELEPLYDDYLERIGRTPREGG